MFLLWFLNSFIAIIKKKINNQAAEKVKQQVRPFIDLIGKDNLYVLVNKEDLLEFDSKEKADKFANDTIAWSKQRAENLLSQAKLDTEKEISKSRRKLLQSLEKETKVILEKAHQRLQENFAVKLALPPNPEFNSKIGKINIKVNNLSREVTD